MLAAGTEGIGVLALLPLLALLGLGSAPAGMPQLPVPGLRLDSLGTAVAVFLSILAMRQLVVFLHHVCVVRTRLDFAQALRVELFTALAGASWRHFSTGVLHRQSRLLTQDSHRAGDAAQHLFGLVTALVVGLVQLAIAGWVSLPFVLPIVATAVLAAWLLRTRVRRIARLGRELSSRHDAIYGLLGNLLPMLRIARLTGRGGELTERFAARSDEVNRSVMHYVINHSANAALIQLGAGIVLCLCIVAGVRVAGADGLALTLLVLVFARLTPLMAQAHQLLQKLAHDLPAVDNVLDTIDRWQQRQEHAGPAVAPRRPARSIAVVNLRGGYGDPGSEPVLRDLSASLPVGRVTALMGPTGAGKTTFADLLSGMLPALSGSLELDGRELPPAALPAWRQHVGYVDQEALVFTGSLRENLLFAAGEVGEDWLRRVLAATTFDTVLAGLPDGLDAPVGEQGAMLSGGQKKRLAVARELLRRPWLLILDEATSSLDAATVGRLLLGIKELPGAPTVLLITHDAAIAALADGVLQFDGGRLAAAATPS